MKLITVLFLTGTNDRTNHTFKTYRENNLVETVTTMDAFPTTSQLKEFATILHTPYLLLCIRLTSVLPGEFALERMIQTAEATGAGMLYSDYYNEKNEIRIPHPTIEYQPGSLRDDFDFGSLLLYRSDVFKNAVSDMDTEYKYATLYDLRLKISQQSTIVRIPESLYSEIETDHRLSGEKQFDYVDPKNRDVQIEMETACTAHLKNIHAWLPPEFQPANFDSDHFPVEATIVIPVKNRIKTIADAVHSALNQQTDFDFNILVVDNHSTDGTGEILSQLAANHPRLIHYIPQRNDLAIGGCWTTAIMNKNCGKFAVQLDSDDLYINDHVLQAIVNAFYQQNCAMVVGSYKMVNFNLEDIPPGIVNHREWTPENGRNNALRINGLGAPRAFHTSILRKIKFPDVSYGEDYAVGLAISREYQIGRIYDPLYLCRRWNENSDAALDIQKLNTYNFYKDKLRTMELHQRISMIKNEKVKSKD